MCRTAGISHRPPCCSPQRRVGLLGHERDERVISRQRRKCRREVAGRTLEERSKLKARRDVHLLIISDDEVEGFVLTQAALRQGMSVECITYADDLREALVSAPEAVLVECVTVDASVARAVWVTSALTPALIFVVAEMIIGNDGIGHLILDSQRTFRIPEMYAGIFTLAVLGYSINWIFVRLEHMLLHGRPQNQVV